MRVFLERVLSSGYGRSLYCSANTRSRMTINLQSKYGKRPWREAASLIIAAPAEPTRKGFALDYSVLYLKRASKSSFMPNVFVYPGGAVDQADRNPKWLDVFSKIDKDFKESVMNDFFLKTRDKFHSDIFPSDRVSLEKGLVPNEIAFRICAIREAFEESGLLLLTNDLESHHRNPTGLHCQSVSYLLPHPEVKMWRGKVHDNADEFMNLCLNLNMVPDIWSVKEWCQWLTPTGFSKSRNQKRFDTVFYCCCLKEMPSTVSHDNVETTASIWKSPADMIQIFLNRKAFLAPPQILENMRLLNFMSLEKLSEYICRRAILGLERWTPHIALTRDSAVVHLMPGDDAYPDNLDVTNDLEDMPLIDNTYEELEALPTKFHFRWNNDPKELLLSITATAKLRYGQISPVPPKSVFYLPPKL